MKKTHIRDYAINAFRVYVLEGRPKPGEMHARVYSRLFSEELKSGKNEEDAGSKALERLSKYHSAYIADVEAVACMMERFAQDEAGQWAAKCIELVYFACPEKYPARGEITARVIYASQQLSISETSVYRFMHIAVRMFAVMRGLNASEGTSVEETDS